MSKLPTTLSYMTLKVMRASNSEGEFIVLNRQETKYVSSQASPFEVSKS